MNNIIKEGTLNNGQAFYVRCLMMGDLPLIMNLQEVVKNTLKTAAILKPLSQQEFSFILSGNGSMIGIFTGNELIAFRALLIPEINDEHLGVDAGLTRDELAKVIYSEVSNVHPTYRGNGLQTLMERHYLKRSIAGDSALYVQPSLRLTSRASKIN
ncbi:hypothetical protein GCM10011409_44570 [Lentibacillus populi]|uniref:Uncharacterized protein n=1 Tax=Lentibacillus populi TaxID=1827502 RepID=A0A9W5U2M7_9BACI|nr:hypothetical protein GCM10011409_44570 [Lentibacillus populi]